jgi:hypothetical protein
MQDLHRDACEFGKITRSVCDVISILAMQDASDVISGDTHRLGRPILCRIGLAFRQSTLDMEQEQGSGVRAFFPKTCESNS